MTSFSELRSQAMQVDVLSSAPTGTELYTGRVYFDTSTGKFYVYDGSRWIYIQMTTTSTSTTTVITTTSVSTSTSITTTSISVTTTSSSSSSSSTSTTLL